MNRILIVEDESLIALMLEDYLDILGKQVVGVADCVEAALALVAAVGFDAAILDINLRDGEKSWPIADALAAQGMPFLFASGGSGDAMADAYADRPVLAKPFTLDGLSRALEALGQG